MVTSRPSMDRATALLVRAASLLMIILIFSHADRCPVWAQGDYGIQVASYQDLDTAVKRVNYLKRLGYGAFYRYETVTDKGKWYRVYIAKYPTMEQAEEEASALKKLELISEYKIRELDTGEIVRPGEGVPSRPEKEVKVEETPRAPLKKPEKKTPPEKRPQPPPKPKKIEKPSDVVFLLHVSSFKEEAHAAKKVRMLEGAGQKAFYVEEELSGGIWYRVYIGKYETEKTARAAGESLKKTGHISYYKPIKIDRSALE